MIKYEIGRHDPIIGSASLSELRDLLVSNPSLLNWQAFEKFLQFFEVIESTLDPSDDPIDFIETSQDEISRLGSEVNFLTTELDTANMDLERQDTIIKSQRLSADRDQIAFEVHELKARLFDRTNQITMLQNEIRMLIQDLTKVKNERDEIQSKLDTWTIMTTIEKTHA